MDIKFDQTYRIVNKVNTFYGRTGKVITVYADGDILFQLDRDHPQPTGLQKTFSPNFVILTKTKGINTIVLKTTDIRPYYGQDGTIPRVLQGSGRTFNMTKHIGEILETGRNVLLITNHRFSMSLLRVQGYRPKGALEIVTMTPSVAKTFGWSMECPDRLPNGYSPEDWELVIEPEVFNSCAALYHRFDPPIEDIAQACFEYSENGDVNWPDIRTGRKT